jgi:hypothetical protein
VWLTFLLFTSNFSHRTSALLSFFVLETESALAESASSWNFKSVGATVISVALSHPGSNDFNNIAGSSSGSN